MVCPFCAEELPTPEPARCPSCRESLLKGGAPPPPQEVKSGGLSTGVIILIVIGVVCVGVIPVIGIIAAVAIPNLIEARKHGNEAAAVGALKTITTSQSLFREGDKDNDGNFDYGDLQELSDMLLLDRVLGSGTKQGYFFDCQPDPSDPEFKWIAVANPAVPGTTGDRYFAVDQSGVVYYSLTTPFQIGPSYQIPPGATPLGR